MNYLNIDDIVNNNNPVLIKIINTIDDIVNNHNPVLINNISPNLPLNIEVVHNELINSINEERKMKLIIKINSDKKILCKALNEKGEVCDIEAKYIHINKKKNIYKYNKSHLPLCWFCGLHLMKRIENI